MSAHNSTAVISTSPTELSSIVGPRRPRSNDTVGDEAWKRTKCAWFEVKLQLTDYRRDKKNEEHGVTGRHVRVNSKRLHCSYDIPAEECYRVLKRLRDLLAPGLRAQENVGDADEKLPTKHLRLLYDWTICSDFTALVIPKTPTVLWLDVDCVRCKSDEGSTGPRGDSSTLRHVKSSVAIETVLSVVAEYRARDGISTCATDLNRLYVTRGRTCGMHMFFPQIVVHDEYLLQELWSEVGRRLREVDTTAALAVDTGCSAMPLPLARDHNGLTRIVFCGRNITSRLRVVKPSLKDMAGLTTFYHLVADRFEDGDDGSSPTPSVVGSCATTTNASCDTRTGRLDGDTTPGDPITTVAVRQGVKTTQMADEDAPPLDHATEESTLDGDGTTGDPINTVVVPPGDTTTQMDDEDSSPPDRATKDGTYVQDSLATTTADAVGNIDVERKSLVITGPSDGPIVVAGNEKDDAASTVSTTRRGLVQTDLRDLCAKMKERKRKNTSSSSSGSGVSAGKLARSREPSPQRSEWWKETQQQQQQQEPIVIDDDGVASSFLCAGYAPPTGPTVDTASCATTPTPTLLFGGPTSSLSGVSAQSSAPPSQTTTDVDHRYVSDDEVPPNGRVPVLYCGATGRRKGGEELQRIARAREEFETNMRLTLDGQEDHQTHETDIQFLLSGFNTELDFYTTLLKDSTPLVTAVASEDREFDGMRTKDGCSLHDRRETCPPAMFPDHMPFVLHDKDFVTETEWIRVLTHYFDEYLNNAPFLLVMSYVLRKDANVTTRLGEPTRLRVLRHVQTCLSRFKYDAIALQRKNDVRRGVFVNSDGPKHTYEDKCTVVAGLIAVCSFAFEIRTPVFTDLLKVCRTLLVNNQQTLDSLNTSTMSTAGAAANDTDSCDDQYTYDSGVVTEDDRLFDESVSRAGGSDTSDETSGDLRGGGRRVVRAPAQIGNSHAVLASLLRWNYTALADQTLWSLFFYYYHVHTDALERINDETMHGGLMVTAVLQAYLECQTGTGPVDVRSACNQVYVIDHALRVGDDLLKCLDNDEDRSLMPPPPSSRYGGGRGKRKPAANGCDRASPTREQKKRQFNTRNENSKKAQRRVQKSRDSTRDDNDDDGVDGPNGGKDDGRRDASDSSDDACRPFYKTGFTEVLSMVVRRYLRPMTFDETTVVYTETGYDQGQNEFSSAFAGDKDLKRHVMDVFNRSTLKYSMPHGDLLMYNTDVMGTVHRRSACTNNLVLNLFENMYGGCMSYLTRRYGGHLKLFNRFNGDAYRLVVECRHAVNGLVRSIEISYLNLILRQPIVPPVLEADITIRNMFMRDEELLKGAFVCLNAMDYVRAINMFTRHTRSSQKHCQIVESFLDRLATAADRALHSRVETTAADVDEEARALFRTVYLFYLLYIFEVLYKIRHAYRRDGSYSVSVERLSWELDVRVLVKLFFGVREFKTPRGLSPDVIGLLDLRRAGGGGVKDGVPLASDTGTVEWDYDDNDEAADDGAVGANGTAAARCINTRPVVSTVLPDKMSRMMELFGKKGLAVLKSYAPLDCGVDSDNRQPTRSVSDSERQTTTSANTADPTDIDDKTEEALDSVFSDMTQTQLEEALYSAAKWYDNCRVRVAATRAENTDEADKRLDGLDTCMDVTSMDTFLRTQLRVHIDNNRLAHIERAVRRDKKDFHFCTQLPLRVKMMALVLATHSVKRLTARVAEDFCRREYRLERTGVSVMTKCATGDREDGTAEERPDQEWARTWARLLCKRKRLLSYCRSLSDAYFPESYFVGLQPDNAYQALYTYMLSQPKYVTLHALQHQPWAIDVCAALNYLLVINGYDPELVELCLRLFLGFEWPGQWAKRIFVWKSNSNAGKSFFFEHVLRKAFDQSTCINDPKGGKENAPEKSEYYKNFVLMINEFSTASACELKKLCSTSSYKYRMNFGNQMIQAFMVGKLVFNCNTLPATTDHATIQRVALVPLPFWFQKRQTVVESMLNWTRGHCTYNEYEKNFKRNVSQVLNTGERRFFLENRDTKNEDDLFNKPNEISLQLLAELSEQNEVVKASMFQVQNKTSQVYMSSCPPINTIVGGIVTITRYFCRFRFFNNIKEPVDYSVLPTACNAAAREWQRISQPYFEWKERYRVQKDSYSRTKVSAIHASINHFAKNHSKTTSFFDLIQFFEWDFAEQKIPYYNAKEDEYNVRLDPIQE